MQGLGGPTPLDLPPRQLSFDLRPVRPNARARRRTPVRPHQLGLGGQVDGFVRVGRCPQCAHELGGRSDCTQCGAFTCTGCDTVTSQNGGDGKRCARCAE